MTKTKDELTKELTEEELSAVNGGYTSIHYYGKDFIYHYPIGYTTEICDCVGGISGHCYTHTGTLTKYGVAIINGYLKEAVYFTGDSDIEGWYPESLISELYKRNYADYDRINGEVIILRS